MDAERCAEYEVTIHYNLAELEDSTKEVRQGRTMKCYFDFAVASFFRPNRIALYFTEQRSARKTNAKKSL